MLNEQEKYRYDRHLRMVQIGVAGQEKLKAASVLVIGAGGLGCPVLLYLAAAGVGRIGIVDFDTVNVSNLQRQVIFTSNDIGKNKAQMAAGRLRGLNDQIRLETYPIRLTTKNARAIISDYDIIVDASDNFPTRYMVNDATLICGKPLVYGSVYKFEGQVSVFNYRKGPSYRCLFPDPARNIPSCEEVGVMGVLCGIIGTRQANEVLKIILGIGNVMSGRLDIHNSLTGGFIQLKVKRNDATIKATLSARHNFGDYDYETFCGHSSGPGETVSAEWLFNLADPGSIQVLDVREDWEEPTLKFPDLIRQPLSGIDEITDRLSREKQIVVICQNGLRSQTAVTYLRTHYHFNNIISLDGGINAAGIIEPT